MPAISTPVSLGTASAANTSADLALTLSRTFTTNALVFYAVVFKREDSVNPTAPTSVTGGGVTWALETTNNYRSTGTNRATIFVYRASASTPSGTTVTVALGQTVTNVLANVVEVAGARTGTNGGDALLQELTGTAAASATGPRLAFNTLSSSDNGFVTFGSMTRGTTARTITPIGPTTPTELIDISNAASSTGTASIQSQYVVGAMDVNPSIGFDLSGAPDASGIVGYEVAAVTGPAITVQPVADTVILTNENTATFSVTATGTGGLTYDWELETGVASGVYANLADGNGATWTGQASASCTATLTAKTLSGRRVRCNVTDDNGTTTSTAVALTIYDGPQLTTFPATNGSGVSTSTLTCDYVTGVGEAIEVRIPLSDGDVAVTVTTT